MGLLDHFRHSRSSSQPPAYAHRPFPHGSSPAPGPTPSYGYHHHHHHHQQQQPPQHQQFLAPPQPYVPPPQPPAYPPMLFLTFDGWSGRTARFTTHEDPQSQTIYTYTSHTRSPQLRFTSLHGAPFADVDICVAQHLECHIHGLAIRIPSLGWNTWEYAYASPALGGRTITWTTPEGPYSDNMTCVMDGGAPVGRWVGQGFAMAKRAGRLEIVQELAGRPHLMDEMVVVAMGLWWMRMQTRNGVMV